MGSGTGPATGLGWARSTGWARARRDRCRGRAIRARCRRAGSDEPGREDGVTALLGDGPSLTVTSPTIAAATTRTAATPAMTASRPRAGVGDADLVVAAQTARSRFAAGGTASVVSQPWVSAMSGPGCAAKIVADSSSTASSDVGAAAATRLSTGTRRRSQTGPTAHGRADGAVRLWQARQGRRAGCARPTSTIPGAERCGQRGCEGQQRRNRRDRSERRRDRVVEARETHRRLRGGDGRRRLPGPAGEVGDGRRDVRGTTGQAEEGDDAEGVDIGRLAEQVAGERLGVPGRAYRGLAEYASRDASSRSSRASPKSARRRPARGQQDV